MWRNWRGRAGAGWNAFSGFCWKGTDFKKNTKASRWIDRNSTEKNYLIYDKKTLAKICHSIFLF